MKYFIDTEFSERGPKYPIELISVGIVDERGREFYRENKAVRWMEVNDWVHANVFPHLAHFDDRPWDESFISGSIESIRGDILTFVGDDPSPEFWGYYCAYDYVVLSQLMGGMASWPDGWPYSMHDLRQWLDGCGLQHVKQDDDAPHDALQDARWVRDTYLAYASQQEGA